MVDYLSRESTPAPAPAASVETRVADVAAAAAHAAVAAMAATDAGSSAAEPPPATDADWARRVRVLELESELAELRGAKRARR